MSYCPQCKADADGYPCGHCGGSLVAEPPEVALQGLRRASVACYLLGALSAYWYLNYSPQSEAREVRFHGWQSVWLTVIAIAGHLAFFGVAFAIGQYLQANGLSDWNRHPYVFLGTIGGEILLLCLLEVALLIVWIQLMLGASEGRMRCLPVFGRWAAERAGITVAATGN